MSVGKNSISRISTSTTTKKKTTAPAAKVEKVEEVAVVEAHGYDVERHLIHQILRLQGDAEDTL